MSVSGLKSHERAVARELATRAALLSLHHAPQVHYSQGPHRWDGISKRLLASRGEFPTSTDCSASATWWLAQPLLFRFKLPDIVNGTNWRSGYTGTLAQHGREVHHLRNVVRGDLVLYGPAPIFEHVAMVVGHRHGCGRDRHGRWKCGHKHAARCPHDIPQVVSHGSEPGPFLLNYNYRHDVGQIRRYI
jgi:hypothetical protein